MGMDDRDGKIWMDGKPSTGATPRSTSSRTRSTTAAAPSRGVRAYNTVNGPAIFRLYGEHTGATVQLGQDPAHEDPLSAPGGGSDEHAQAPSSARTES